MSTLLELPTDIRERILSLAFEDRIAPVDLLCTCKQLHLEGKPHLFKRPQTFRDQDALLKWVPKIDRSFLSLVTSLNIQVTDLDPEPGPAETSETLVGTTRESTWPKYEKEAEKVFQACLRIPNVVDFAIKRLFDARTQQQHDFYQLLLSRVSRQWPNLQKIRFDGGEQQLDFLKAMPDLETITLSGFSTNSPMETVAVLSRLRHLRHIDLVSPPSPSRSRSSTGTSTSTKTSSSHPTPSFTRETLKSLRGLQSLSIIETHHPPAFFTPDFLQALDSAHRTSLRTLKADLAFTPDIPTERVLHSLIASSSIKHLDLLWPGFNEQVLDFLPSSLSTLRIPPCPPGMPPYCLLVLAERDAELPTLRELKVARSRDLDSDEVSLFSFSNCALGVPLMS